MDQNRCRRLPSSLPANIIIPHIFLSIFFLFCSQSFSCLLRKTTKPQNYYVLPSDVVTFLSFPSTLVPKSWTHGLLPPSESPRKTASSVLTLYSLRPSYSYTLPRNRAQARLQILIYQKSISRSDAVSPTLGLPVCVLGLRSFAQPGNAARFPFSLPPPLTSRTP